MKYAFVAIVAIAIIVRLVVRPPDIPAALILLFYSGAGFRGLQMLEAKHGQRARGLIRFVLLPLVAIILIGQVFFAIQEVLPFIALAAFLGGAAWFLIEDRTAYVITVAALSLPLVAWCGYSIYSAGRVVHFRTLDAEEVQSIAIGGKPVDKEKTIAAMRGLLPFSASTPERLNATTHVLEIRYRDGSITRTPLRRGPRKSWIVISSSDYAAPLLR